MHQDLFNADRRRLFSIAYRMLGSASDAEDVLQDAWLAARRPLEGRDAVLNFLLGLRRTARASGIARHVSLGIEDVNSEPALVIHLAERVESIFVLSIDDGAVSAIRIVRNPDKLAHIDRRLTTQPARRKSEAGCSASGPFPISAIAEPRRPR